MPRTSNTESGCSIADTVPAATCSPVQKPQRELRDAPCPDRQRRAAAAAPCLAPCPGAHRARRRGGSDLLPPAPYFPPIFGCTASQGLCSPRYPAPRLPHGFAGPRRPSRPACPVSLPGAAGGEGQAAKLPGLTVAALPTLARHVSRPPVTSGHLRGGSAPAPEQPGRPFTPRSGAWRCPLPDTRPVGPCVPEGADRH